MLDGKFVHGVNVMLERSGIASTIRLTYSNMECSHASVMNHWAIEPGTQFVKDKEWYAKKHPRELAAVLNNVTRLMAQLKTAKNAACVAGGYMHTEGKGILAIDQKGGGTSLQETRLYVYADQMTRVLHLITIGNKNTQPTDIKLAHAYAESLKPTH